MKTANKAIALDKDNPVARHILAWVLYFKGGMEKFRQEAELAISLNPNDTLTLADLGIQIGLSGDWERGSALLMKAMALNPHHPFFYYHGLSFYYYEVKEYEKALKYANLGETEGYFWSYMILAPIFGQLGRDAEAREAVVKLKELYPDIAKQAEAELGIWMFPQPDVIAHWMDGLDKAGLFEEPEQTRPVIAVLPFTNMSGDPEQEYFSDGITEDIITRMSQFQQLGVIARNSTFQYKGQSTDARVVGAALGAHYLLEGSVRRGGKEIRITAQLIDTSDGTHVWANTYDKPLTPDSIFQIQDEIAAEVVATVADRFGVVVQAAIRDLGNKPVAQLSSYECVLRTTNYVMNFSESLYHVVRDCLDRVTAEEPDYADAWAARAEVYVDGAAVWGDLPMDEAIDQAVEFASRAIALDPGNQNAHYALTYAFYNKGDLERFLAEADRAIEANPNNVYVVGQVGTYLAWAGHYDRGVELVKGAMALNPNYPAWLASALVLDFMRKGQLEDALEASRDYLARAPDFYWAHAHMAWTLGLLGRTDEARNYAESLRRLYPEFEPNARAEVEHWFLDPEMVVQLIEGLRLAGFDIPDSPAASD